MARRNTGEGGTEGLGTKFWLSLLGIVVGAVLVGAVLFIIFGWAWATWGFIGALLGISAIALTFGWIFDRREQNRRRRLAS
jgi:Kef-type K+ transport system membrane component KefB